MLCQIPRIHRKLLCEVVVPIYKQQWKTTSKLRPFVGMCADRMNSSIVLLCFAVLCLSFSLNTVNCITPKPHCQIACFLRSKSHSSPNQKYLSYENNVFLQSPNQKDTSVEFIRVLRSALLWNDTPKFLFDDPMI
jgi:hypothetical protein